MFTRRQFFKRALAASAVLASGLPACSLPQQHGWHLDQLQESPDLTQRLTKIQKKTLSAVQEQFLPSNSHIFKQSHHKYSPGAIDVMAIDYLESALMFRYIPARHSHSLIHGTQQLYQIARDTFNHHFSDLNGENRDIALNIFLEHKRGDKWFEITMNLTLEAFLGDPVHGGNPNEIVWRWAGVKVPFPRPQKAQKPWASP